MRVAAAGCALCFFGGRGPLSALIYWLASFYCFLLPFFGDGWHEFLLLLTDLLGFSLSFLDLLTDLDCLSLFLLLFEVWLLSS